jgi:CheY-like chemotaxis protein
MKIENVKSLIEALNGEARNTMHSILGFLELVNEGGLDPAQREYIHACRVTADRYFRGLDDLRLVLGLIPEEKPVISDFAPEDLFADVAEVIRVVAGRQGPWPPCQVHSRVPPVVSGDFNRIGQALLRVAESVVNGINGGDLHLGLSALPSPDGSDLTFEILAPGTTLAPVLMSALQHSEFEFDASLTDGAALGVAASRKLVTGLAGHVDASADTSAGTRIAITIPVGAPSGAVAGQAAGQPTSEGQRALRILVAEDSENSFQLFKAYLRGRPHTVSRAMNGAEAVELAITGHFDLLFMDIRMPVMDGYTATKRIRELETGQDRPRIPIVVLSGEDIRSQRREGSRVGCSGHLAKPLKKSELLEAIRAYAAPESVAGGALPFGPAIENGNVRVF